MRLERDAAALKARPLLVRQTVMLPKRRREVAAAERRHVRRQQSCFLGTLGPNPAKAQCRKPCTNTTIVHSLLLHKNLYKHNCSEKQYTTKTVQQKQNWYNTKKQYKTKYLCTNKNKTCFCFVFLWEWRPFFWRGEREFLCCHFSLVLACLFVLVFRIFLY